jgi:hypothetical protein
MVGGSLRKKVRVWVWVINLQNIAIVAMLSSIAGFHYLDGMRDPPFHLRDTDIMRMAPFLVFVVAMVVANRLEKDLEAHPEFAVWRTGLAELRRVLTWAGFTGFLAIFITFLIIFFADQIKTAPLMLQVVSGFVLTLWSSLLFGIFQPRTLPAD